MPRKRRLDPDQGWHHVMNRGVDRMAIFRNDDDRRTFVDLLGKAARDQSVEVAAYCLVGNHFHLVVHCPTGGLSRLMWQLGAEYARVFNHRAGRDGPLFRGRFLSIPIGDDAYLRHVIRYVHRNSLDLGVTPHAWPWSSCQPYLGRRRPPSWLIVERLRPIVGDAETHRLDLDTPLPSDTRTHHLSEPAAVAESWRVECARIRLEWLVETVASIPGLSDRMRADLVRVLAIDHLGLAPADLFAALGAPSSKVLRNQVSRARQRISNDPGMRSLFHSAAARLDEEDRLAA